MAVHTRVRGIWNDKVVTVVDAVKRGKQTFLNIRDEFGFLHENIPAKQVHRLDSDDERSSYTFADP